MTWTAPEVDRAPVPRTGGEAALLAAFLDYHRATLLAKCAGLTASQLRERAARPSTLSLHGLLRHLADAERWWFRRHFAGEDLPFLTFTADHLEGDFDDVDTADAEADYAMYVAEVAAARDAVAGRSLDETFTDPRGEPATLRWLYTHLIAEYARHNGHADLLRERIDGTTGA